LPRRVSSTPSSKNSGQPEPSSDSSTHHEADDDRLSSSAAGIGALDDDGPYARARSAEPEPPKMRRDLIVRYQDRLHGVLSCYGRK
jgi:hypothetical protein